MLISFITDERNRTDMPAEHVQTEPRPGPSSERDSVVPQPIQPEPIPGPSVAMAAVVAGQSIFNPQAVSKGEDRSSYYSFYLITFHNGKNHSNI